MPSRLTAWLLGAVIAVEALVLYLVFNGGSWLFDDNFYLSLARQYGFGWSWLMNSNFGHFGMAFHAVFSLQNHLMPVDYRWALLVMLVGLCGSIFLLQRVLSMLFAGSWLPLLAAAWFGISVLFIRPLQWWTFGLQAIPTVLFDLLCLYAYLRYQTDRRARWVAVSAGALIGGLLFYEKPAFMVLYIALIRVLFISPSVKPRALWNALRGEWWIWAAYVVVLAVWAVGYKESGANVGSAASPTLTQWLAFFRVGWAETLVPATFGLTFPVSDPVVQTGLTSFQVTVAVCLQVVVVIAVIVSVWRRPSAWRAWACLAALVIISGVLTGIARIGQFGPGVGADLRYWLDFSWLIPVFVCFAFSSRAVFTPVPPSAVLGLRRPRPPVALAVTLAMLGYGAASIANASSFERTWPDHAGRLWEANLERSLAAAARMRATPVVVNNLVPWYITDAIPPFNKLSEILPDYGPSIPVDGPLTGPLRYVDTAGALQPARIADLVSDYTSDRCLSAGTTTLRPTSHRTMPTPAGPYYLLLTYSSSRPIAELVSAYGVAAAGTGAVGPVLADPSIALTPNAHRSIAWLGQTLPERLSIGPATGSGTCVTDVQIVTLKQ